MEGWAEVPRTPCLGNAKGAPRGLRSSPGGNRKSPRWGRGVSGAWKPARNWEAGEQPRPPPSPGNGLCARARLSPTPHFPSVPEPGPADRAGGGRYRTPHLELWILVVAPPVPFSGPPLRLGSHLPKGPSPGTHHSTSHPQPLPAPGASRGCGYRGRVVEHTQRGSAALSRRRHCALRHGAGLASSGGRAGETRTTPGKETLPLAVGPGKSSLPAASPERAGGRLNGEGSREVGNGCHVAQVDHHPPPSSPPRAPATTSGSSQAPRRCMGPPPRGRPQRPGPAGVPASSAPPGERGLAWWGLPRGMRPLLPPPKACPKA